MEFPKSVISSIEFHRYELILATIHIIDWTRKTPKKKKKKGNKFKAAILYKIKINFKRIYQDGIWITTEAKTKGLFILAPIPG